MNTLRRLIAMTTRTLVIITVSAHVAACTTGIAGHDGTLKELSFEEHP